MNVQERVREAAARRGVRYIQPVTRSAAGGVVAAVYRQVERDYGALVPPFSLHSPAPAVLRASWSMVRETLVADGAVSRQLKEAVATAVSRVNTCPYCVDAHATTLYALDSGRLADAIVAAQTDTVLDPGERAIMHWVSQTHRRATGEVLAPPFPAAAAPELIGTAVAYHYLNRMVNVFLDETPLPARGPALRKAARRLVGPLLRSLVTRPVAAGGSLALLPAAELPEAFRWAAGHPTIAGSFAGVAALIEEAGQAALPEAVRALVITYLDQWDGQDLGMSHRWLADAVQPLPAHQQPAARLALLVALASYQVDADTITAFRASHPDDAALVKAAAWAAFAAARQIGGRLAGDQVAAVAMDT
ncbi:MAG TPA: carboxymuconolactone decarboxylase family protein [Chloroflexaceae bacterium]|nr:carboxymuconolactone decarboxylase family protein [Chloroflexaceae bacterium]